MSPRCPATDQDARGQAELPLTPSGSWTIPAVGGGALALRNAGGVLSPQVTCRALGIGAYLVRLGQRVIQVENSHIILTGATALNKVTTLKGWPGSAHVGAGAGSF